MHLEVEELYKIYKMEVVVVHLLRVRVKGKVKVKDGKTEGTIIRTSRIREAGRTTIKIRKARTLRQLDKRRRINKSKRATSTC